MNKKIYISGKISGIEAKAPTIFKKAEDVLISQGWEPINPMTIQHKENSNWVDFMKNDIKALFDCDSIFMLKNWKRSKGARLELNIAKKLQMNVIFEK